MSSLILPLADAPDDRVKAYLRSRGLSPAVIEWKYFDDAFNRKRNRGYVWLHDDMVEGFLGLIPFRLSAMVPECSWTCDWSVQESESRPGIGIRLLHTALSSSPRLFALGGNAHTRRLLPRLAAHTAPDAALTFRLSLRLGAILQPLRRRLPFLPTVLDHVPIRRPRAVPRPVRTDPGVSPALVPLLGADTAHPPRSPAYDFEYIDWQIGRCPLLSSATAYVLDHSSVRAAALYWAATSQPRHWRLALWDLADVDALGAALTAVLEAIRRASGTTVTILAPAWDAPRIAFLIRHGFAQTAEGRHLYVLADDDPPPSASMDLSYLDTDLAHRFPLDS